MSTAPMLPLVPVDEYLTSSYHPDLEYVDGVLVERGMPTIFHGLLQVILIAYFRQFEREYRFKALAEVRTQIIERARYRIPDILLCAVPIPKTRIVNVTPLAVVEILSPDDKTSDTLARFRDYSSIGVPTIVQMDPENHVAHRFEAGSLLQTQFQGLCLPHINLSVPFDSEALLAQLRAEHEEATAGG